MISLTKELKSIAAEIRTHLNDQRQGEMIRDGVRTVIIGAPNVGKSSFLNMMSQRQVSIVTPIAGTTRDIIESTHNFSGYPVVFADTAGLRKQTDDIVEMEGISRAKEHIKKADLILLIIDALDLVKEEICTKEKLISYIQQYTQSLGIDDEYLSDKNLQVIANKIDLLTPQDIQQLEKLDTILLISCKEQQNLKSLLDYFQGLLTQM